MTNSKSISSDGDKIVLDKGTKQTFKIDTDDLIEELENIGDYNGIEGIKEDLDSSDK